MLGPDQAQPNCNSAQWGNGILMTLELPLAGPTPMPHAPPPVPRFGFLPVAIRCCQTRYAE